MKKRNYFWILVLVIATGIFFVVMTVNKKIKINPVFAPKYEFHGVDVSHYQGRIDWSKLAQQNVDFAFIKATEGSSYLDECFFDNWEAAEETDLYIGAYHFFSFDSEGEKQAAFYIETVGNLSGKLVPAVDVEFYGDKESNPPAKEEVVAELKKMLNALEDYYQVKPVIYSPIPFTTNTSRESLRNIRCGSEMYIIRLLAIWGMDGLSGSIRTPLF
ncbi:MAG: glycosyl hydrolase family 25 [Lachnospiraceae bacterium]|nr:glycosyl hydrolase family 25 [Lachnospiraceae bacterium]